MKDYAGPEEFWMSVFGEEHGTLMGVASQALGNVPDEVFGKAVAAIRKRETMGPILNPTAFRDRSEGRRLKLLEGLAQALRGVAKARRKMEAEWEGEVQ